MKVQTSETQIFDNNPCVTEAAESERLNPVKFEFEIDYTTCTAHICNQKLAELYLILPADKLAGSSPTWTK